MRIHVEVSARHIHLTRRDIDFLFGQGYALKKERELSQPPDFAAQEKAILKIGEKAIALRVIGPERSYSQVEISMTDAITLGIEAPLRVSGNIDGAPEFSVEGPAGKAEIPLIIAQRHFHISPNQAEELVIKDGEPYKIQIQGERAVIFDNVIARVGEYFQFACHLDTDEANAAGLDKTGGDGELILPS